MNGTAEKANHAIEAMLKRQLSSSWHELQPSDGPLKFSPDPWVSDPDGETLRTYLPYWEPGLNGRTHPRRQGIRLRGVCEGRRVRRNRRDGYTLWSQKVDPANLRLIEALKNEDENSIMRIVYDDAVNINNPLPFSALLSYEVSPPLHFLIPWAKLRTIDFVLLLGANVNLPWTYPPATRSTGAGERKALVRALLFGDAN